jgi:pimeloyl-ACP methyl ester carboxylesterase
MDLFSENATVVLVHGAWADGSSWHRVILPLLHQGLKVICAPIPLTSLSGDAAALNRVLGRTDGPVLLAGHAYAGAVIAAARDEKVRSLVYIAALAPDEGETVGQVFYREEPKMSELVAVVTGASQGIGRATAVRLAKDFSALVLAARNGEALKEVAAEVKSSGG